jgi:hypothetical protein
MPDIFTQSGAKAFGDLKEIFRSCRSNTGRCVPFSGESKTMRTA